MHQMWLKRASVNTLIGTGIGILLTSILIFAMAAVLTVGNIPAMLIAPITVIFLALGAFYGGFISAKSTGEKGLFCGCTSAIIFFFIAWITGMFFDISGFGVAAVIKFSMIVVSGGLGGIIGVNYIKRK